MSEKMQDVLEWRSDLLLAGHYGQLADQFVYPATMHSDNGTRVVQDRKEMMAVLEQTRADWRTRGVSRVKVQVSGISETRHGRFHVRAVYHELGASGWLIGQMTVVLYFLNTAKGIRTVMSETLRQSAALTWPGEPEQVARGG